jgi:hypothetical protein
MSRRLGGFSKMAWASGFILTVILILENPVWAALGYYKRVETSGYESAQHRTAGDPLMLANGRGGHPLSSRENGHQGVKTYQNLTPDEKARLKRKYREWRSLPHEEQRALRHRMEQWRTLPDKERQLYKQRYDQWQQLSPKEQEGLRKKLENWDNLSPSEKDYIRKKFKE